MEPAAPVIPLLANCPIGQVANGSLRVKDLVAIDRNMERLDANARRATLIAATIATMLEKGFARATTRDVAARLQIGRGLIHHYFSSWDVLQRAAFSAVCSQAQADAEVALAGLNDRAALDALLALLVADRHDAHWRLVVDAWDEARTDRALAAILVEVGTWWRGRLVKVLHPLLRDDAHVHDTAWRILALADGLSANVLLADGAIDRAEAMRLLSEAVRLELA